MQSIRIIKRKYDSEKIDKRMHKAHTKQLYGLSMSVAIHTSTPKYSLNQIEYDNNM